MSHHRMECDCVCEACGGTGIYQGRAEGEGFGVVCYVCHGTGKERRILEYDDFEGRRIANVTRVLECNPGIMVRLGQGVSYESFGGISYADWLDGYPFPARSEMREHTCPAWWYQSANYLLKPAWEECIGAGKFTGCSRFGTKRQCWERWDMENNE